ncbi:hypothetical protein ABEV54_19470 [Peribacillus psychrosaccharolyticus]|uniref:hypothetical protein n=1 Tax=Peribacillus psychrosaccharolyticus TaxID=1407 RepID=UPI003D273C90
MSMNMVIYQEEEPMLLFLYNFLILLVIGLSADIHSIWFSLFLLLICGVKWLSMKQTIRLKVSLLGSVFFSIFFLFNTGFTYSFLFTLSFYILFWSGIKNNKQKVLFCGLIVLVCLSLSGLAINRVMLGLFLIIAALLILLESHTVRLARSRLTICIAATSGGIFIYMLLPTFLAICKYLLFVVFTGSAFVTGPVLNNGVDLLLGLQTKEEVKEEPSEDMMGMFLNEEAGTSDPMIGGYLLFGGMLLGLVILLSRRLQRIKNLGMTKNDRPKMNSKLVPLPEESLSKPPHHLIRKKIYGWEMKLAAPFARRKAEGFSHWLSRLPHDSVSAKERIISIYQDVRYGNRQVSKGEIKEFEREFAELAAYVNKKRIEK